MDAVDLLGTIYVVALLLLGLMLLWRLALSPAARARPPSSALPLWPGTLSDLMLLLLLALGGAMLLPTILNLALRSAKVDTEIRLVLSAAAFQLGLLGGATAFFLQWPRASRLPFAPWRSLLLTGAATFAVAMPLVLGTELVWQFLLTLFGLPVNKQDVLELFLGIQSPALRLIFILAATVIAPLSEELLFRAGLFRFFRGRTPRWIALLVPALLFGGSHLLQAPLDALASLAPLVVLGIVFSLAYERTGTIGTTMVAHALFNLNTIMLILLGVSA